MIQAVFQGVIPCEKERIFRRKDESVIQIQVEGHALTGKAGEDIVCAAVSALTQTTATALHGIVSDTIHTEQRNGHLKIMIPLLERSLEMRMEIIVSTLIAGLLEISREHPASLQLEI